MNEQHTPGPWQWDGNVCDYDPEQEAPWIVDVELSRVLTGTIKCKNPADARLLAAAPDLLACQTMGAQLNTPDFLDWIADRLEHIHGEDPNVDYILSLRARADAGRAAIARALPQGEKL